MDQPSEIEILDVLDSMRRSYWMYLPSDCPTMDHLVSHVLDDVIRADASKVMLLRSGAFACVQADIDWMARSAHPVPELFSRVVPNGRVNSHRSEVMLAAFADGYYSTGPAGAVSSQLSVRDIPDDLLPQVESSGRCLIWRSFGFVPPHNARVRPTAEGA